MSTKTQSRLPSPRTGRNGGVRLYGTISNDLPALEKALRKIRQAHRGALLRICYEAGPCGFALARRLAQLKVACQVVAPSMIPQRAGERVKTDRRDARKLARLLRAGELTPVYIPEATDEAMRDLCRARTDASARSQDCEIIDKVQLVRNDDYI